MDIATQKPISFRALANVKGAHGAACATVFLREDEATIRESIRKTESMKDRLKKLGKFTLEDHAEFRATLEAKRLDMQAAAKKAGFGKLDDYFKSGSIDGQVARSLQVTISLWTKCSKAMQNGFKPDYKMAWADISSKATAAANPQQARAGKGTPTVPGSDSKGAIKVLDKAKAFVKANLQDDKGQPRADVNRAEMIALMCIDCTVEELDSIIAKLTEQRTGKIKAREDAAKTVAKAAASSNAQVNGETGNVGTPVPVTVIPAQRVKAKGVKAQSKADALVAQAKQVQKQTDAERKARRVKATA